MNKIKQVKDYINPTSPFKIRYNYEIDVNMDLIVRLSNDYKKAKISLDRATNFDIHNSKRNIKHQRCAEDYNYKMDLLYYAIDKIYQQYNPPLKPCTNE